jgi:hypothetical protein
MFFVLARGLEFGAVDGAGAVGARDAAGAAAAVHRRRRRVLRHQRGGVLGVRVVGVGVPPQPARRAALGRRAHQRRRLPPERRLPTRTPTPPLLLAIRTGT